MDTSKSRRLMGLCCAFCGASLLITGTGTAQAYFDEVTKEAIPEPKFTARSLAAGDYNNDGWPDFLLAEGHTSVGPSLVGRVRLLHNGGDGTFGESTAIRPGNIAWEMPKGGGAIFGDYDNDGDLDLFVPVGHFQIPGVNKLLRNDRGIFSEVGVEAGLTDAFPTDNAIWLDFDRDGYIDLYTGNLYGFGTKDPAVMNRLSPQ